MSKPVIKDSQLNVRMNGDILQSLRNDAQKAKLSLGDYIVHLYEQSKQSNDSSLENRLAALEAAVFAKAA